MGGHNGAGKNDDTITTIQVREQASQKAQASDRQRANDIKNHVTAPTRDGADASPSRRSFSSGTNQKTPARSYFHGSHHHTEGLDPHSVSSELLALTIFRPNRYHPEHFAKCQRGDCRASIMGLVGLQPPRIPCTITFWSNIPLETSVSRCKSGVL